MSTLTRLFATVCLFSALCGVWAYPSIAQQSIAYDVRIAKLCVYFFTYFSTINTTISGAGYVFNLTMFQAYDVPNARQFRRLTLPNGASTTSSLVFCNNASGVCAPS